MQERKGKGGVHCQVIQGGQGYGNVGQVQGNWNQVHQRGSGTTTEVTLEGRWSVERISGGEVLVGSQERRDITLLNA